MLNMLNMLRTPVASCEVAWVRQLELGSKSALLRLQSSFQ